MANLDEKDFQEKMIEGMEFAEEQRDLQMDVSKEIRDNTDVNAEATMENTEVLKKYEVVFGRMMMTNVMQASFMESMSLVMHEVRDIQKRQLDLEIEKMRDAAREEKVTEHEEAALPKPTTDEDDKPEPKKPNPNATSFLDAFLPGLGTFFGTLFGGSGILAVLGKGALAGLAVTVLSPVREFVVGAVEGALEGFEVSDETFNTIAPQLDNAVRNGMIAAFLGPKRAAVGTAIGSIISGAVFDFFDENEDGLVQFAGLELSKTAVQNIGSAIGFALGAALPLLIKRALPAVMSAIGIRQVVSGAVRGALPAAAGLTAGGAGMASKLGAVAQIAKKAAIPLAVVGTAIDAIRGVQDEQLQQATRDNGEEKFGVLDRAAIGVGAGVLELVDMLGNASGALGNFVAGEGTFRTDVDRAEDFKRFMVEDFVDPIKQLSDFMMARDQELRNSAVIAPSREMMIPRSFIEDPTTQDLQKYLDDPEAYTAEKSSQVSPGLGSARDASRIATIEKGQAAQNNVLSAPMNVGPRTTVNNHNTTNNFNTQTDPSRSLSTRPSFLPQ